MSAPTKPEGLALDLEFGTALCYCSTFTINGVDADYNDFGEKYDRAAEDTDEYCCGDMRFERSPAMPSVLEKYKITENDYDYIATRLEEGLSFGSCGLCS